MDDITKNISDKVEIMEKEGSPVRSCATSGRLFIESAYKHTMAAFSPVKAQSFVAGRANLFVHSIDVLKKKHSVFVNYCILYPSTVVGVATAAVAGPSLFLFRLRTTVFAAGAVAALTASAVNLLAIDTSAAPGVEDSIGKNKKDQ